MNSNVKRFAALTASLPTALERFQVGDVPITALNLANHVSETPDQRIAGPNHSGDKPTA